MEWRLKHELGSGHLVLKSGLANVTDMKILRKIETKVADLLQKHAFAHLDQSVPRCEIRELTQAISRIVFEQGMSGIVYKSKLDDKKCAALFEGRSRVVPYGRAQPLREDFRPLGEACGDLGINL